LIGLYSFLFGLPGLAFVKESLFYSVFQSSHTAGQILIDYPFFIKFSLEVDLLPRTLPKCSIPSPIESSLPRYPMARTIFIAETRMDFVGEHLKGLLRRLNSTDADEIEDVSRHVLGSSFSNE
jgi:hypothetical protein